MRARVCTTRLTASLPLPVPADTQACLQHQWQHANCSNNKSNTSRGSHSLCTTKPFQTTTVAASAALCRVRFIVSGGAPLAPHVEDFCNVCMAPLLQASKLQRAG